MRSSNRLEFLIVFQTIVLGVIYLICVFGGYKTFHIWDQLNRLMGSNPLAMIDRLHGLRYLVVWPAVAVADYLHQDRDTMFGFLVVFNIVLTTFCLARVQARLTPSLQKHWSLWFCFYFPILAPLSFAMNGRLSYMLLGSVLMTFTCMRWLALSQKDRVSSAVLRCSFYNIVALTLLFVSSGCFTVGTLTLIAHTIVLGMVAKRRRFLHVALSAASLAPFVMLQYAYVEKNLSYYGGSPFAMLTHGPGEFLARLNPSPHVLAVVLALLVFCAVLLASYLKPFIERNLLIVPPLLLVINALLVGAFGYSALLTGLMPALALTLHVGSALFDSREPLPAMLRRYVTANLRHRPEGALIYGGAAALLTLIAAIMWLPRDWEVMEEQILETHVDLQRASAYSSFLNPSSMAIDAEQNIYVVESNNRILKIDKRGKITVYAGDVVRGDEDGNRLKARFSNIGGLTLDGKGNLYVVDTDNDKIKTIDAAGNVKTIAGNSKGIHLNFDEQATDIKLNHPHTLLILPNGELIISDTMDNAIVRIEEHGLIEPLVDDRFKLKRQP